MLFVDDIYYLMKVERTIQKKEKIWFNLKDKKFSKQDYNGI